MRDNKWDQILPEPGSIARQRLYETIENIGDSSEAKFTAPSTKKKTSMNTKESSD